jgi:hypothetical protein
LPLIVYPFIIPIEVELLILSTETKSKGFITALYSTTNQNESMVLGNFSEIIDLPITVAVAPL